MRASFSPLRRDILAYLEGAQNPVSAREIFKGMHLEKKTAFSSVYRALWYLEENGLVSGFSVPCDSCGKDRYFTDAARGHRHYFHCDTCHRFIEIGECPVDISGIERKYGVTVRRHSVTYSGTCKKCGK
jgi:Fur family ferric uptake transcriptional regulator